MNRNSSKIITGVAITALLVAVALLKSTSIWNYSYYNFDEQYVVALAVGFLGSDLNPKWFIYHTLPIYILSVFYHIEFAVYFFSGLVSSKVQFVSMLFSDNRVFYITARVVFSMAYTAGVAVLAMILWINYRSAISAIIFFFVASLFPDSLSASNYVRVDTFVYVFLVLVVYFCCYAEKSRTNFILSIVFAAAAVASKIPAVVIPMVLFLKLLSDVYRGIYPRSYLVWFVVLIPVLVFLFMPYSILDFERYSLTLKHIISFAQGEISHLGKLHFTSFEDRLLYIYQMFVSEVGWVSFIGTVLYVGLTFRRPDYLFPVIFVLVYAAAFAANNTIDSYWFRPVFPFMFFFTFAAGAMLLSGRQGNIEAVGVQSRSAKSRLAVVGFTMTLFFIYASEGRDSIIHAIEEFRDQRIDSRVLALHWINENIPADSRIWIDDAGHYPYFPEVTANRLETDRQLWLGWLRSNVIMNNAYSANYDWKIQTRRAYDVKNLAAGKYETDFVGRLGLLRSGDYVITSSYHDGRYFDDNLMKAFDQFRSGAREYYARLGCLEQSVVFEGKGPKITILRYSGGSKVCKRSSKP